MLFRDTLIYTVKNLELKTEHPVNDVEDILNAVVIACNTCGPKQSGTLLILFDGVYYRVAISEDKSRLKEYAHVYNLHPYQTLDQAVKDLWGNREYILLIEGMEF